MKKTNFITIIIILFYLAIIILPIMIENDINLNPNDYARITDVDYKAIVTDEPGGNGKILVTERLTFDIHAASKNNLFWELWRDLPEDTIDGVDVNYKVNSVKQILPDGKTIKYKESSKLYWDDSDYTDQYGMYGPGKWYYSKGPYSESNRQYECVFFYVDGLYREQVVFEIEYEMNNAALRYNDCSELYLSMYSEKTIKYLKSFKGQILFPDNLMPDEDNYYAHTYGTNSNEFPYTVSNTLNPGYTTFSFELNKNDLKFKPYNQYLEFSLISYGADKHTFTKYASRNDYYYDDVLDESILEQKKYEETPEKFRVTKLLILIITILCSFLIIKTTLNTEKRIKKKYKFYEPEMNFDYFREIPSNLDPVFASSLVFCKDKASKNTEEEYAAILLSLARKGYIELVKISDHIDWETNNIKLIVKHKPQQIFNQDSEELNSNQNEEDYQNIEPLTLSERFYLNLVIRYAKTNESTQEYEITMSDFQKKVGSDYENTNTFVKNISNVTVNVGIKENYFQKIDYKEPKNILESKSILFIITGLIFILLINFITHFTRLDLAFGSFFILGFSLIISGIHIKKLSPDYVLLTQFGENEYEKWHGLYKFLNSETLIKERTVVELPLWEQYLIYATAFGISEKVIKAIKIRCPQANNSPILSNPYYRTRSFYKHSRLFRHSAHTASHIARSGSHGGHGGYGGGGRGGGGGGRRSLKK